MKPLFPLSERSPVEWSAEISSLTDRLFHTRAMGPYLGPRLRRTTRSLRCRSVVSGGGGVTLRKPMLRLREWCVLMRSSGVSCRWANLTGSQEVGVRAIWV
jgi:hypothetical protein